MRKSFPRLAPAFAALAISLASALGMAACSGDDDGGGAAAVTGVTLNPPEMTLTVGGPNGTLTAEVLPAGASQAVDWSSSHEGVASVAGASATATINPVAGGTATITARSAADPAKAATCTVTVVPAAPDPTGVDVDPPTMTLAPGAAGTLAATVLPAGAGQAVVWTSGDETVAMVVGSGDGLTATVTAVAEGAAMITATAAGFPAFFGTCNVTVASAATPHAPFAACNISSMGIKDDGGLWAWGSNLNGQIGDGSGADIVRPTPVRVGSATDWVSVTGMSHVLALKVDGSLWAWGNNWDGQIGVGTAGAGTNPTTPVQVGGGTDWAAVSVGWSHSVAIKRDGSLWAWGNNDYGQLGLGNATGRNAPVRVGGDADWFAVAAGGYHTMAIKRDGSLWAWGCNQRGQLGLGDAASRYAPQRVGGDSDWESVSCGMYDERSFTAAIKKGGSLWAWGRNDYGQLGLGDTTDRSAPQRVGGADGWTSVSAGQLSMCATMADGSIWAWGWNGYGQLGLGDEINRDAPQRVGGADDWASVSVGPIHVLAIKPDGGLWVWGRNYDAQLGLGDYENRNVPTKMGDGWRVPVR